MIDPDEIPRPRIGIRGIALVLLGVFILMTLSAGFYTIDGTERGVMLNWKNPDMKSLTPGFGIKIPYQQEIVRYNIQTQKYVAMAQAASKDLQDVKTEVTVNYRLDPEKIPYIHINLGHDYENKVIAPAVQEVVKQVTAEYTANDLIQKRASVKAAVENGIRLRLQPYYVLIDTGGVSLTGFEYSAEFNKAIEQKVVAEQLRDKAKNDLERIQIEKEQKIAQSQADEKYATPNMIALKTLEIQKAAIDKWNGVLPAFVAGDSSSMMMINPESFASRT